MKQSQYNTFLRSIFNILTPAGRIGRLAFWIKGSLASILFFALFTWLEYLFGFGTYLTLCLYPPFFWTWFVISARRFHDIGKSSWWLLILLVPLAGLMWVIIELGFRRGSREDNRYGRSWIARPDYMAME